MKWFGTYHGGVSCNVGIVLSGYMRFIYFEKKEQDMDNGVYQKEGEVYMKRLEKSARKR